MHLDCYTSKKDGSNSACPFKRRSFFLTPLLILMCALIGGVYGPRVQVASAASSDDDVKTSMQAFTKVYSTVEQNFADPVSSDKAIYKGAIPGMLADPRSALQLLRSKRLRRSERRSARALLRRRDAGAGPQRQDDRGRAVRRFAGLQSGAAARRRHHRSQRQIDRWSRFHQSRRASERTQGNPGADQGCPRRSREARYLRHHPR